MRGFRPTQQSASKVIFFFNIFKRSSNYSSQFLISPVSSLIQQDIVSEQVIFFSQNRLNHKHGIDTKVFTLKPEKIIGKYTMFL